MLAEALKPGPKDRKIVMQVIDALGPATRKVEGPLPAANVAQQTIPCLPGDPCKGFVLTEHPSGFRILPVYQMEGEDYLPREICQCPLVRNTVDNTTICTRLLLFVRVVRGVAWDSGVD